MPPTTQAEWQNWSDLALNGSAGPAHAFIKPPPVRQFATNDGDNGSHIGELIAELKPGDFRQTTNAEFIRSWKQRVPDTPGLENFLIKFIKRLFKICS